MANNLGIPERTLAQVSSATDSINVIGGTDGRLSAYQPLVVRITDHVSNVVDEEDDPDRMAIFVSKNHGEPWCKDYNTLNSITHQANAEADDTPTNVTVLFPNFDYTEFE